MFRPQFIRSKAALKRINKNETCHFYAAHHWNRYYSAIIVLIVSTISRGSPLVSCWPQKQVIKHRPRPMQKAYPGLLEPGYSYISFEREKHLSSKHRGTTYLVTVQAKPQFLLSFLLHTDFLINKSSLLSILKRFRMLLYPVRQPYNIFFSKKPPHKS